MISMPTLLSSCVIATALLSSVNVEGFSTLATHKSSSRQPQQQLFDDTSSLSPTYTTSALSMATDISIDRNRNSNSNNDIAVNEFDLAATELASFTKRVSNANKKGRYNQKKDTSTQEDIKITGIEAEFPKRKIKASIKETGQDSMKYYIKSMCNHDLLNKNEEIILAREIQILLKWEAERETLEEQLLR
jgi:hypothetical protein